MKYNKLGLSGIEASNIGLGTWALGGRDWGGTNENEAIKAIHASIDSGINLIDTAPIYGLGLSEEIVGKAIKGKRDKVIIATKCGTLWHQGTGKYTIDNGFKIPIYMYLGIESIKKEVEISLNRLNVDYVDLYLTHWPDSTTKIEDTVSILSKLKKEGKIRAIGACNLGDKEINQYIEAGQLDCNQENYNMLDRGLNVKRLPLCIKNNISFLAYSPLKMGLLTGKIKENYKFKGDDARANSPSFSIENRNKVNNMLSEMDKIAKKYNITITQLVIAWTISQDGVSHVLSGARNKKQALENASAGNINIEDSDITDINKVIDKYYPV